MQKSRGLYATMRRYVRPRTETVLAAMERHGNNSGHKLSTMERNVPQASRQKNQQ